MKALRVKIKEAEKVRKVLVEEGLLDKNYKLKKEKDFLYFPILKNIKGYKVYQKRFEKIERISSLKESLKKKLSKKEMENVKTSMSVIGNIAILEVDKELEKKKKLIAETLLETNKQIKTVVRKVGGHGGVFRLQKYQHLAGKKTFETIHKESGARFFLDLRKTYFSSRLSTERLRVAKQIKKGESVLVLFSGIGAYPIIFSKNSGAKEIVGVEINPDACAYAEQNVILNKVRNVQLFCGDVKGVIPQLKKKFDRILMPLPSHAGEYFPLLSKVAKKSAIIHYYTFEGGDKFDEARKRVKQFFKKSRIRRVVKCGQPKPRTFRICLDFTI